VYWVCWECELLVFVMGCGLACVLDEGLQGCVVTMVSWMECV
jgi:hypothetical protein